MSDPYVISVYSEAGGVGKTTTAVSISMALSMMGYRVLLVDLDPRGASTHWLDVKAKKEGFDIAAILNADDPRGYAQKLAVPCSWNKNLFVIPSGRHLANLENVTGANAHSRLKSSFIDSDYDFIVLDCPNRQTGLVAINALYATNGLVYAVKANLDGVHGLSGARKTLTAYRESLAKKGIKDNITELGIVCNDVRKYGKNIAETASYCISKLAMTGLLITPFIESKNIVERARIEKRWIGSWNQGEGIAQDFTVIVKQLLEKIGK